MRVLFQPRPLAWGLSILAALAPPDVELLQLAPQSGSYVLRIFQFDVELEQTDSVAVLEGEVIDRHPDEIPALTHSCSGGVEFIDRYVAVRERRVDCLIRSFQDHFEFIQDTAQARYRQKTYAEQERTSPLVGRIIEFRRSGNGQAKPPAFVETGESEDPLLANLHADANLRFLLPNEGSGGEVKVGSEWAVDVRESSRFFQLLGDMKPEKVSGTFVELHHQHLQEAWRAGLDGQCQARVESIDDGMIQIEVTLTGQCRYESEERARNGGPLDQKTFELDGSVEVEWNVEADCLEQFSFDADLKLTWKITTSKTGLSHTTRLHQGSVSSTLQRKEPEKR